MIKRLACAAAMLLSAVSAPVLADEPGRHPAYLHALSDLRTAQWQINHRRPEDGVVSADEAIMRDEVGAAIQDFERAAWRDGKRLDWQPPPDVSLPPEGRLHAAVDLIRRAQSDVAREEDDPRSRGAQQRGLAHLDAALGAANHAIEDVRRRHDRRE
jgi:hypothetical protein